MNLDRHANPITELYYHDSMGLYPSLAGGLTKREYAAISLRVPMSGDEELDKMIRFKIRLDIALAMRLKYNTIECSETLKELLKESGL